jgi:hypothetical protein
MFIHGWHTSRVGRTTARSVVRGFMRSKGATSLIERKHCIQHQTVFVAKIRPLSATPVESKPMVKGYDGSKPEMVNSFRL